MRITTRLLAVMLVGFTSACSDGRTPAGNVGTTLPNPGASPDPPGAVVTRSRYAFANQCFALKSQANGKYVAAAGAGYAASAAAQADAAAFYFKPSALGEYLLYNKAGQLLSAGASAAGNQALAAATDAARFVVKVAGDALAYPPAPRYDIEPTPEVIATYRNFNDPNTLDSLFTFASQPDGRRLTLGASDALTLATAADGPNQQFAPQRLALASCKAFPEAQSSAQGETFKGKTADGRVLGMADVHVHISSTTFLGNAQWGAPFHRFGVTHALGDCDSVHGSEGERDVVGTFLGNDTDGHDVTGWPTFPEWPAAEALTHQAIYWKWLERAWLAGLRIAVNDVVENGTLCELQRGNSPDQTSDCNEMNSAARQTGTMYAMQDYIDAQYGGRGAGWFHIVYTPAQARAVIEAGKLAVVLGIEISNFLNCQITYNLARTQEPYQETGSGPNQNSYACAMTETGADNEILTQLNRLWDLGVRQVISIHEFDNAFGGNGIFFPIINLGNRENSGGAPSGSPGDPFAADPASPTGEFWTTYNCPIENVTPNFSGYLWEDRGGSPGADLRRGGAPTPGSPPGPPFCQFTGQGGRPGGSTLCYPDARQCNARWMTPIGVYMYSKLMQMGFIFDFDHMELEMKTQALELAEAQPIAYPFVSTHGTFGGISNDQGLRVLRNGGFLYPSLGSSASLRAEMDETFGLYNSLPAAERTLFGFGFGTDTNGLSGQAGAEPGVTYPFTLFDGPKFDALPDFNGFAGVVFERPNSLDADGAEARFWDITTDHSAHYGMLSDMVEGLRLNGTPEQLTHLYNSAERFLRTWERTEAASAAIEAAGGVVVPADNPAAGYKLLRPAPKP